MLTDDCKQSIIYVAVSGDRMLKISVKGSQDGGWGLTQKYKKAVVVGLKERSICGIM